MTNKSMPWIKQYPNRLHDVRLAQLNDRQQLRYYQLYLLAGHLNTEGAFVQDGRPLTTKEIAFFLRVKDADQLAEDMKSLKKCGLLKANGHGPYISEFKDEQINWMDRQQDDRERQQRLRLSRKGRADVTRDTGVSHSGVTLLEREEESDKESDKESEEEEKNRASSPLLKMALNKLSQAKITISEKEQIALSAIIADIKGDWIDKAIKVSAKGNKRSAAYIIGILKNWRSEQHANNSHNNSQSANKPAPRGRQTSTHAATSAAAKLVIAKRKANVQ